MEKFDLRPFALKGAEQRLLEIADEARRIFEAFSELREQGRGFDAVGGAIGPRKRGRPAKAPAPADPAPTAAAAGPAPRRRHKMSAAGKKRIADAARKRWAEWRRTRGTK